MQFLNKKDPANKSLGYYLNLVRSETEEIEIECVKDGPYRASLTVRVPKIEPIPLLKMLAEQIHQVQGGRRFPVRMMWENMKEFCSLEELSQLGNIDGKTPYYVYGTPQVSSNFDVGALYRKQQREKYKAKKERKE